MKRKTDRERRSGKERKKVHVSFLAVTGTVPPPTPELLRPRTPGGKGAELWRLQSIGDYQ